MNRSRPQSLAKCQRKCASAPLQLPPKRPETSRTRRRWTQRHRHHLAVAQEATDPQDATLLARLSDEDKVKLLDLRGRDPEITRGQKKHTCATMIEEILLRAILLAPLGILLRAILLAQLGIQLGILELPRRI